MLIETTMTATAASACNQKTAHVVSIWPLMMFPALILMMAVMIMKTLRHKIAPSASFLRTPICTRQRSRTGIDITKRIVNHVEFEGRGGSSYVKHPWQCPVSWLLGKPRSLGQGH